METGATPISANDIILLKTAARHGLDLFVPPAMRDNFDVRSLTDSMISSISTLASSNAVVPVSQFEHGFCTFASSIAASF
jgi:hypothetical protein